MLQFLQVCRNLRTFVVVPENLQFTHLGAKKTVNLGFRAKKTEFPAMCVALVGQLCEPVILWGPLGISNTVNLY